jgi:peptidoglycan L-alanyl-D-glutamate endopeptidase CwlK
MLTNLAEISQQRNASYDLLCPFIVEPLSDALVTLAMRDVVVQVFEGFRSPERQRVLYEQGRTAPGKIVTNARPWHSFHQYGLAVDLVFKTKDKKWSWDGDYKTVAQVMQDRGFEWLGEADQPHFQMRGKYTAMQAYEITRAYGVQALWNAIFQSKGKIA